MMFLGALFFFFLVLLPNAGIAAGLPMPQDRDVSAIKTEVVLVPVDVSVRKKDGTFVDNLQAKDFVVYDNGIARQIELFAHEEMPLDVALIVDGSGSEQPYVRELQKAAMNVLQQLDLKNDRVALFCIGMRPVQLTGLTQNRHLLTQTLGNILKIDGTDIKDALWQAAGYLQSKGPHRRRAIILISDNYESERSKHSNKETYDKMLEAGTILYSIQTSGNNTEIPGFATTENVTWASYNARMGIMGPNPFMGAHHSLDANPKEIALLARETGGEVLNAQSASDLPNVLKTAILSLKRSYTLGFYLSDNGIDGSYHALKVRLNSRTDCSVRARKGYYVPGTAASKIDQKAQASDASRSPSKDFTIIPIRQGSAIPTVLGDYIKYILSVEKKNPLNGQPVQSAVKPIDFAAVVKHYPDPKGKPTAKIDLQIDLTQLFFDFIDDQYKGDLFVGILQKDKLAGNVSHCPLNYSEEGFERAIQSKISFSVAMPPSMNGDIRILVFQPFRYTQPPWEIESKTTYRQMPFYDTIFYGIQSVQIQP